MKSKPDTSLYFTTVVVVEKNLVVLGSHLFKEGAEPTMTRFLMCKV